MKEEIILKKENSEELNYEELKYFFEGYVNNDINDEDMTKLLKAICKNGLSKEEIFMLTEIFIKSGETIDLSSMRMVVDKHSTGGVGDKTTLIIAPIIAACGVKIGKMSGRALGYTGGTIDKLESIKGLNINLTIEDFIKEINDINMAITSQTGNLVPMDKKVYALRDVTGTTESIGLIAVSIMSKKIASGAKKILIDIKVGKGALIKTEKDAKELAHIMIEIGKKYGREVVCMLTRMDNPLGDNIGNKIEVLEAIDVLKNKKNNDLKTLIVEMSSMLVSMGKNISLNKAKEEVNLVLKNGKAYDKFIEFVKYQKGDISDLKLNSEGYIVKSLNSGYITSIDSEKLGSFSMSLGAGRKNKEDEIDYNAGIILNKNVGDYVKKGSPIATIYGKKEISLDKFYNAFEFSYLKPIKKSIIIEIIKK